MYKRQFLLCLIGYVVCRTAGLGVAVLRDDFVVGVGWGVRGREKGNLAGHILLVVLIIRRVKTVVRLETEHTAKDIKKEIVEVPSVKSESASQPEDSLSDVNKDRSTLHATRSQFDFVDSVATFHATAVKKLQERQALITDIGPHRRALCARHDLAVRRVLCKVDKVPPS